jgi:hypothetical protein
MRGTPLAGAAIGAEASLCKAGVRAGPLVAEFSPNLNTGASISTTHVEADLLGFGFSFGSTRCHSYKTFFVRNFRTKLECLLD